MIPGIVITVCLFAFVLFSIPNFDAEGHLRFFFNANQIRKRYDDLVKIEDMKETIVDPKTESKIFLVKALRR